MSHIFEALRRSESEGLGVASEHTLSIATEATQGVIDPGPIDFSKSRSVAVFPPRDSRLICLTARESLGAEKFRFLGVRLRQLQQDRPFKKLLITSAIPEEGKSMVSGNLATALARKHQQKILLLEGDLRRPSLSCRFGLSKLAGLTEWLQGDPRPIPMYHLEGPGFWFLPAGHSPEYPLELMQSERLSELLYQVSAWFDWVVIDSPPVLPLADTGVWMRLAEGIVLIIRKGTTEKRLLERSLQMMEPSKLLGVVVNSSQNNDDSKYYSRYGPATAKLQGDVRQRFNWDKLSKFPSLVFASPKVARKGSRARLGTSVTPRILRIIRRGAAKTPRKAPTKSDADAELKQPP